MTSEKIHIIFVRALFYSFILAPVYFWAPMASAQGVSVDDLSENFKASTGFTLKDKATTTIETPWGPKHIYDPVKDQCAKDAFKSLYDFANEDDYFQDRPTSLRERSEQDFERKKLISNRKDVRYLVVAKNQSLLSLPVRRSKDSWTITMRASRPARRAVNTSMRITLVAGSQVNVTKPYSWINSPTLLNLTETK